MSELLNAPYHAEDMDTLELRQVLANMCNCAYEQGMEDAKSYIAQKCHYLLNCGMGKQKSLEHLIKILEKKEGVEG